MSKVIDLKGRVFGRLTVLFRNGSSKRGRAKWDCICECGNKTNTAANNLLNGDTLSCGCLMIERVKKAKFVHGVSNKTTEYRAWVNMKTRCYRVIGEDYPDYGGRGIIVCGRWKNSFVNFLADMGKKPTPQHSIERRNTDGHYEPDNCYWGTEEIQVRNKRNNRWLECNGLKMIITDWARYFGIDQGNLSVSLKTKSIETMYNFYMQKHGSLPAPKEYIAPCNMNKPINLRKVIHIY